MSASCSFATPSTNDADIDNSRNVPCSGKIRKARLNHLIHKVSIVYMAFSICLRLISLNNPLVTSVTFFLKFIYLFTITIITIVYFLNFTTVTTFVQTIYIPNIYIYQFQISFLEQIRNEKGICVCDRTKGYIKQSGGDENICVLTLVECNKPGEELHESGN